MWWLEFLWFSSSFHTLSYPAVIIIQLSDDIQAVILIEPLHKSLRTPSPESASLRVWVLTLSSSFPSFLPPSKSGLTQLMSSGIQIGMRFESGPRYKMNWLKQTNILHGLSPRANYTDRATSVFRRSDCQLLRIKGATWSAWRIPSTAFWVF
jgi:hypothetical protein